MRDCSIFFFKFQFLYFQVSAGLVLRSPCRFRVVSYQVSELLGLFEKTLRVGNLAKMGAGVIACDVLGSEVQLSTRKDHFRDISAEKVFAWRLWNREKFETWPKSRAAARLAAWIATGRHATFLRPFRKISATLKRSFVIFSPPDMKGFIVISERALLQIPPACISRVSALRCLL